MNERLQKILARAGAGSRRACERLITQKRVRVNGQVAQLGQKANPDRDSITLDGTPVHVKRTHTYVALYKPPGVLSHKSGGPDQRRTARQLISLPGRLYPVGRLDLWSEGLLLMTDDGPLTQRLTHPRYEHSKEYHVRVNGHPDKQTLDRWRRGVFLEGQRTAPAGVSVLRQEKAHTWLRVVLREGRKRHIRRVASMLGHPVSKLIRVRIGPVRLGNLKPGEWRRLSKQEIKKLEDLREGTKSGAKDSKRRPR